MVYGCCGEIIFSAVVAHWWAISLVFWLQSCSGVLQTWPEVAWTYESLYSWSVTRLEMMMFNKLNSKKRGAWGVRDINDIFKPKWCLSLLNTELSECCRGRRMLSFVIMNSSVHPGGSFLSNFPIKPRFCPVNQSPGPGLEAKVIPACHNYNQLTNAIVNLFLHVVLM